MHQIRGIERPPPINAVYPEGTCVAVHCPQQKLTPTPDDGPCPTVRRQTEEMSGSSPMILCYLDRGKDNTARSNKRLVYSLCEVAIKRAEKAKVSGDKNQMLVTEES